MTTDSHDRDRSATWALVVTCFALAVALALAGCGSLYTTTYKSLTLAEQIDEAAAKQFIALDKAKRDQIVHLANSEAAGVAALAEWDKTADKLKLAIEGTPAAVKLARDAMVEIKAGKRPEAELSTWIASAVRLGLDLKALLAAFGLNLKGI